MTVTLAPWHSGLEQYLAGSIYACRRDLRVNAARTLVDAGISVHVDVMIPGEGLPTGVTVDELHELADVIPRERLGVHLIGSATGVEALLPSIPECGDLYLPLGVHTTRDARTWAAIWDESTSNVDLDGYDGVLVMLLEPGTSGAADPSRIALVERLSQQYDVTVDGGVTPELVPFCLSAGAKTLVVGRALLTNPSLVTDSSQLEGQS